MMFTLHRDGTISVRSSSGTYKKRGMVLFDSELNEAGGRKKAIERHLARYRWRQNSDRYSVYWVHPLNY